MSHFFTLYIFYTDSVQTYSTAIISEKGGLKEKENKSTLFLVISFICKKTCLLKMNDFQVACLFCTGHLGGGGRSESQHAVVQASPYTSDYNQGGRHKSIIPYLQTSLIFHVSPTS